MSNKSNTRHTIYSGSDIDTIGGLRFGPVAVTSASGSNHVHVTILPGNKELKGVDISTAFDIKGNPMKYAALVEDLYRRKKLTEEEYQKYGRNQEMDSKETFTASPLLVFPGLSDAFALKINVGDATPEGTKYEKTLHSIAFSDAVMSIYEAILAKLDSDISFRKELLLKGGVPGNEVNQKAAEPARNWFKAPIVHAYHDSDTVVNGESKSIGDLVENQPGVFSLKPITVPLTPEKKISDGAFCFDSTGKQTGDPSCKPDTVWYTRWEYPNANGRMTTAKCIEEVLPYMYISDDNRKNGGAKLNVPSQPMFEQQLLFSCQLPTLYVNKGKAHLIFKTFNATNVGRKTTQKSHVDPALTARKEAIARAYRLSANTEDQDSANGFSALEFPSAPTISDHADWDVYQESFSSDVVVGSGSTNTATNNDVAAPSAAVKRPSFPTVSVVAYPKKTPATPSSSEGSGEKQRGTKRKEVPSSDDGGEEKTQSSAAKKFKK